MAGVDLKCLLLVGIVTANKQRTRFISCVGLAEKVLPHIQLDKHIQNASTTRVLFVSGDTQELHTDVNNSGMTCWFVLLSF